MLMKKTWHSVSQVSQENLIVLWKFYLLSLYISEINTGLKTGQSFNKDTVKYSCPILASFEENIYIKKWANSKYYYKDKQCLAGCGKCSLLQFASTLTWSQHRGFFKMLLFCRFSLCSGPICMLDVFRLSSLHV